MFLYTCSHSFLYLGSTIYMNTEDANEEEDGVVLSKPEVPETGFPLLPPPPPPHLNLTTFQ